MAINKSDGCCPYSSFVPYLLHPPNNLAHFLYVYYEYVITFCCDRNCGSVVSSYHVIYISPQIRKVKR